MIKKLEQIENGYAIIIDRPMLELLGVEPDSLFELTTERGGLFLSPVRDSEEHKHRVERSITTMAAIHRDSLKKLAQ
jgi:antitoxin MazE